ncbi:MAG TPA: hypothetical protein VHX65_14430 [Pirellulales bacterium]|nr:hypothetical protein [Pirellulales bacterium]
MYLQVYALPLINSTTVPDARGGQQIIDTVRALIESKSWSGGDAYIGLMPGAIAVRQTDDVHRQIQKLLAALIDATRAGGFGNASVALKPRGATRGGTFGGSATKPK